MFRLVAYPTRSHRLGLVVPASLVCALAMAAFDPPFSTGIAAHVAATSFSKLVQGGAAFGFPGITAAVIVGSAAVLILMLAGLIFGRHRRQALAIQARRFRTLADATFEGLVFERDGRIVDVNRMMCRLAGSDAATLIGLRLADLIPGMAITPRRNEPAMEFALLLPDGQTRPVEAIWRDDFDHLGRRGHIVAIRDLSQQKAAEARIEQLANFDSLTGLATRDLFEQQLQNALDLRRQSPNGVALLYVGLDRFETLNEALGPLTGQQILLQTARRLSAIVQLADIVARLGHDEFAVIRPMTEPAGSVVLAERIVTQMALPFLVDGQPVGLTASVGVARYPADGTTAGQLMKYAALALLQAKHDGSGQWRHFEPEMDMALRTKRSLEHDLRAALREGQFSLHYQPFIAMQTGACAGYEALLRWNHPERGQISPVDFIPWAEKSGLIVPIGSWVLATACAEAVSWDNPAIISVNLSPVQFVQPGIVAIVADVLRRTGLPAERLELEITEGTLMDDTGNALRTLTALKALGVKIAMDDFGTGYSSLSYLRKFPFDKIKIDRSFISDVEDDAKAESIVQVIINLSRSLRLDVTAEGVETQPQLDMLRTHGCTFAQGFLLGRPNPAGQIGQSKRHSPVVVSQSMERLEAAFLL
jgi:diguanylate cyclase (GGDEF)-like protein/PAS domain S-box-containing protein